MKPTAADALYQAACAARSDISEHLPTLCRYAQGCRHITEFGCWHMNAAAAFVHARPKTFVYYGARRTDAAEKIATAAEDAGVRFTFHLQDTLQAEIEETDLLLLDSVHTYEHVRQELARHAGRARKFIILHDTETFGQTGGSLEGVHLGTRGIRPAVDEFLKRHPAWQQEAHYPNNNGLTVLKRTAADGEASADTEDEQPAATEVPVDAAPEQPQRLPGEDLSVVIAVHGKRDLTEQCLRTLRADVPGVEVIVVDNASPDGTREWLRSQDVRVIEFSENRGVPTAWTAGLRVANI